MQTPIIIFLIIGVVFLVLFLISLVILIKKSVSADQSTKLKLHQVIYALPRNTLRVLFEQKKESTKRSGNNRYHKNKKPRQKKTLEPVPTQKFVFSNFQSAKLSDLAGNNQYMKRKTKNSKLLEHLFEI